MKSLISLAGDIGAGKGTVGKLLMESVGYDFLSTGNILREIAGKLNMTIVELNKYAETHKEIDAEADNRLVEIEQNANELIIDSRLAWHFVPSSFKVYLSVSYESAAKRIYKDEDRKAEQIESVESLLLQIKERRHLEIQRFHSLYGVKCNEYSNYDLVIQTDYVTPDVILNVILEAYKQWRESTYERKIYLSPTSLFPVERVRQLSGDVADFVFKSVRDRGYDKLEPIQIVGKGDFFYIWDGHKRCSAAILNKIPLIPAVLIGNGSAEAINESLTVGQFVKASYNKNLVHDWEDRHKFTFVNYPV